MSHTDRRTPKVQTDAGFLKLGAELARGGEGAIYEINGRPDAVAKVYLKAIDGERSEKVSALVSLGNEKLRALTAWPIETLRDAAGSTCGFTMSRIVGHKDIHNLYNPRSRKVEFPSADWRFLIRASTNVARAFAVIHGTGVVVGDVNERGVMVSKDAIVRVIDCDSFQVFVGNRRFPCAVGVPTFTPPELQNQKDFKSIVRTANHDNFGLALLIFQLLFMGKHPFAGRFLGRGEMPLEKAIAEFRFVYGSEGRASQMEPPPGAPPLTVVPSPVATLFEKSFSRNGANQGRPTAKEWVGASETLEGQVKKCSINASHYYLSGLEGCPWCKVEATTGVILFNVYFLSGPNGTAFNLALAWAQIAAVPVPGPAPDFTSNYPVASTKPSEEALSVGRAKSIRVVGVWIVLIAAFILCFAVPSMILLWIIGGIVLASAVGRGEPNREKVQAFASKYRTAEVQHRSIKERWDREAGDSKFLSKMRELEESRNQWKDLSAVRQRRYQQLEREREKQQRERFLDSFAIENASIPSIGAGRKAVLESFNIETALDITHSMRVPGFGPALKEKLMDWRRSVEQRFRFDASRGVDPRDIANLDTEIADQRRKLEQSLSSGASTLLQMKNQILTQRKTLEAQVTESYKVMLQAKADMDAASV